jgi:histidinol dehydrogenase
MQCPAVGRRDREKGTIVYPAISRRSGGLSIGINLFPAGKACSFDCPYCEVFAPESSTAGSELSIRSLEAELSSFLDTLATQPSTGETVRDLCLSGDGEPTLSPRLGEALELLGRTRRERPGLLGQASIVLITNSTGFLSPSVSSILERFSREESLEVWAKLDAGTEGLFQIMAGLKGGERAVAGSLRGDGAALSLERVAQGLLGYARRAPVVVQTMLCEVDGSGPSDGEIEAYAALVSRLSREGARISELHLYTYARPSPTGRCAALSDQKLASRASFVASATGLRVRAFGAEAEILLEGSGP